MPLLPENAANNEPVDAAEESDPLVATKPERRPR
jgi:hypothetical protein